MSKRTDGSIVTLNNPEGTKTMKLMTDLFTTDDGLLSLGSIVFTLGMGVFFIRMAQRKMAEDMVARLDARLSADPSNVDGWTMLIRSRMALGQPDRARAALEAAIGANPGATRRLREQAEIMGGGGSNRP